MPGGPSRRWFLGVVVAVALLIGLVVVLPRRAVTDDGPLALPSTLPSVPVPTAPPSGTPAPAPEVLLAVGDIADCDTAADDAVAQLASRLPGTIALLGDTVYERGTTAEYRACFEPGWGAMRPRIRPAVGNHEYVTEGAAGYFDYFGPAAGSPGKGWYSYDLGAWHVVVLNSNCDAVDCGPDSDQVAWLRADLAAHGNACLLGYWHHPRWSSGRHGSQRTVGAFWEVLREHGADVVLSGHDHTYERISADGIRQFVVGTGGKSHYPFEKDPLPTTEVRSASTFGLLWLALAGNTYEWQFLGLGDAGFTDAGRGEC
jgi:acid phosphatase type 7